jgi:glycosyltransferase involved in cell wall biosynthesis
LPLGLDPVEVPASDAVAAVRGALGLARPYLLYVGTLEPRKNLPRLLAAFGRLPPEHDLVVAGPAGWGDSAAAFAGDPRVRLVGFVDEPTKAALYAGAAAVCYPSLREGFGLPVLEAMAYGAPVVTSRGTATAEVGGDAVVLVDPVDVDDIARGITDALARRPALAAAGRCRAALFTWDATADKVVEAYEEAAS